MIGIVGGIGPYAGIDLLNKIYSNTLAKKDQDYLSVILLSLPSSIEDRTQFLLGEIGKNPGHSIAKIILKLEALGAEVAGIPCNTAHSDEIFSVILNHLKKEGSQIEVLNMISETIDFIKVQFSHFSKIGVLSTTGTYKHGIYSKSLERNGFIAVEPSLAIQESLVHPAIYDPDYGIKLNTNPFHQKAMENLESAMSYLRDKGAEAVILGCTEIPLVVTTENVQGMVVINPTNVLARRLIQRTNPEKLKPFK